MVGRLLAYEMRTVTQISTYLHPTLRNGFRQPEHMLSAKEMVHRELGNLLEEFSTLALSSKQPEKTTNNFKKPGILDFLHSRKRDIPNATAAAVNIVRMYIKTEAATVNHTEIAGTC
ncbi:uncharacterized protein LOC114252431 [Bombyx mandarina]|uniref:Uncharacterized protein LOC114252431 n=1 Tax=Bombyx mandarina TaxID=7092 RepID=A0A6J2KK41_BOMMA|nr:uncharacterized protein LOC114252431 [Bombyx mandarina]